MPLFASLRVADFAAAVLQRDDRRRPPLAVIDGEAPNQFVYAMNEGARRGGVREGMPLAEARARYGYSGATERLNLEDRDPAAEEKTQQSLLELAENATPRFEDSAPGLITLDFTGLRDPHASAEELAFQVKKLGLEPRVAVSRNRFTALCAARTQLGVTHIYPGQEAGFLKVQPLAVLPLEEKEHETFVRWGLRTVGDLAELPENDLTERFGERGAELARLARGELGSTLSAYHAPPQLEERRDLDWEIGEIEPLSFVMAGMLDALACKLQGHNLAAAKLRTTLKLAQGGVFERTLELAYPLTDPRTLLTLVRLDLEAHPPGDAVEGVRLAALPTERRMLQFSLFAPDVPGPEKLAVTLARLTNLVGEGRVGAPQAPDTYRPGASAVATFSPAVVKKALESRGTPARGRLMFRCLRPPWSAKVDVESGAPAFVETAWFAGAVAKRGGPWRVLGEWWTDDGWQYEEWDVEIEGRLYRACCERGTKEWFVTGMYD